METAAGDGKLHFEQETLETDMRRNERPTTGESGQGMVEYTFIVLLVVLVFWLGVKDTDIGKLLAQGWEAITSCAAAPFSCGSGSGT
ncbi:MAG TPA: hypothetical protein VNN77_03775 [candidate division Zixibacteria bacterium]|nr:hypothetical protein [candidate division Zixibacteria bacterium]